MGWFQKKKDDFIRGLSSLFQQVFMGTVGSWGPVMTDEDGNIIDEPYQEK